MAASGFVTSTLTCTICERLRPRLVSGGLVACDDYGMRVTEGVQRFLNEWRVRDDLNFLYNLKGHAIFIERF